MKLLQPIVDTSEFAKISEKNINAFKQLQSIQKQWFQNNKIELDIDLTPVNLERNAKKFVLEIGDNSYNFTNDDQKTINIHWPYSNDNIITIEFEDKIGQNSIKNYNSSWALMRLFKDSDITFEKDEKRMLISFKLDAFRAKYQIMSANEFTINNLGNIEGFNLHEHL